MWFVYELLCLFGDLRVLSFFLQKSVYGYPLPYAYPMMMPPQPRYDGPPMPYYSPQQPPLRPTQHVSAHHLPGRGILSNPFVPLQVLSTQARNCSTH